MSQDKISDLNDFLEFGAGGDDDIFSSFTETATDNVQDQPQTQSDDVTPTEQPLVNEEKTAEGQIGMLDEVIPTPPAPKNDGQILDPFEKALADAQSKRDERIVSELAAKDAIFSYGSAKENITDRECTFEDLRNKYKEDFPELDDYQKVTWKVTYGKVSKDIKNPSADKVYAVKADIEKSKTFLDGLKKAKTEAEKSPDCIVKPFKSAGSKGEIISLSSYKDFCSTLDEAEKSRKAIVVLPSKDGRLYQIRKNAIGTFTAPIDSISELDHITEGFQMKLPKIPMEILMFIFEFFRGLSEKNEYEALVHILYDTVHHRYTVRIPKQRITHASVHSELDEPYPDECIHVMDMHSHNTMPAEFSGIDDMDEKETRLYAVVGRFDKGFPDIKVRAGCAGRFIDIPPTQVMDINFSAFPHPPLWDERLEENRPRFSRLALPPKTRLGEMFK